MSEEVHSGFGDIGFVCERPDDDAGAVFVTSDHFCELVFGICESDFAFEVDFLPKGNFRPDEQSHFVGKAYCGFVVRVMSEPYVVAI